VPLLRWPWFGVAHYHGAYLRISGSAWIGNPTIAAMERRLDDVDPRKHSPRTVFQRFFRVARRIG
jgi:hypothetical protein